MKRHFGVLILFLLVSSVSSSASSQQSGEVVRWSAAVESGPSLDAGKKGTISVTAKIEPGWHVYSATQPPGGPTRMALDIVSNWSVKLCGKVVVPKPETAYDSGFEMTTEFYKDTVSFGVPILVDQNAKPGVVTVTISVRFQACSENLCLPPRTVRVPLALTIVGDHSGNQ